MKNSLLYKKIGSTVFFSFICLTLAAQSLHPKLALIHERYFGKFPKTISFIQKTAMYRADTIFRTQTWYEAGLFPNLFRIDFGDPKEGNSVIYRGDSTYNFRESQKMKPNVNPNILVYLLGGMYFETQKQVAEKLGKDGFDLSKHYTGSWKGKSIEVFGVDKPDSTKSQLWFDTKDHYMVRMIQQKEKSRLECQFEKHQKTGNVWHETHVKIYVNDKLVQTEDYSNFKTNVELHSDFFNPEKYGSWHWFKG